MALDKETLISLTADIVSAHVSNNSVGATEVTKLIHSVYGALEKADAPAPVEAEKQIPAVSVRASIKHDFLVSMIDGKPYRMLKRHLALNGYTPESYRAAFDLPKSYPMVAPNYSEKRRALAKQIGLGRKKGEGVSPRKPRAAKGSNGASGNGRKPRARKAPEATPASGE